MKDGKPVQDTGISKENPMYVTADYMRYNDTTGDVDALGKVDIRHMMDTYQTEYLYGNMITKKYVKGRTYLDESSDEPQGPARRI